MRTKLLGPLLAWTGFVWTSRIRNIWGNDELTTGGQVQRTVVAVVFLGLAAAVGLAWWRTRGSSFSARDRLVLGVLCLWTIGLWLVQGIGIIVDDHDFAFTAIHTALMVVSVVLAGAALRLARPGVADRSPVSV